MDANADYKRLRAKIAGIVQARKILESRIKALLHLRRMHQTDLVAAIGKSDSWLSGFFKGRNDIAVGTLDDIARALGVEVVDLFLERDPAGHWPVQQLGLIQGAPRDPAARASYFRDIVAAYEQTSQTLLRLAAEAIESTDRPAQPPASGRTARDRPTHRKRPESLTRHPKDPK